MTNQVTVLPAARCPSHRPIRAVPAGANGRRQVAAELGNLRADPLDRVLDPARHGDPGALGGSPRASQALYRCSQALSLLDGRTARGQLVVLPDHVRQMFPYVMAHRIILKPESRLSGMTQANVSEDILMSVPAPVAR
ncbi:MAG: hypothetical protein K8M05_38650 [Deltaproteobacteria bacterium]|nr:hypothetical protein [Kofleriaceae bacterium]